MKDCNRAPEEHKQAKGYLIDPFNFIYGDQSLVSKDPAIQETLQAAIDVTEDRLDLDLPYLKHLRRLYSLSYIPLGCINWIEKFKKTYKENFNTYEEYCLHDQGKCVDAVNNSIDAARVGIELILAGYEYEDLPNNMSQACALKKFTGPELIEKWEYVLANLERHERTAVSIKELLFPKKVSQKTVNTTVKLPVDVYGRLLEVAYKGKISVCEAIKCVTFLLTESFQKSDIFRVCNWILDTVNLINKGDNFVIIE